MPAIFDMPAVLDRSVLRGPHGPSGPSGTSGATGSRGFAGHGGQLLVAAAPAGGVSYDAVTLTGAGGGAG